MAGVCPSSAACWYQSTALGRSWTTPRPPASSSAERVIVPTARRCRFQKGENHKRGPDTKNYIEDQVKRRRKKSRVIKGITKKLTLGAEKTGLSFVLLAVDSSGVQTIPIVGSKRHFDPAFDLRPSRDQELVQAPWGLSASQGPTSCFTYTNPGGEYVCQAVCAA
eukprot:g27618.t1